MKTLKTRLQLGMQLAMLLALSVSGAALAQGDLAKARNCTACHAASTKTVGPAFKDIAAKYAGQKDATDQLANKVIRGGSGVWGSIPMPPNPQVTQAEARSLVTWILAQQ